MTTLIEFLHPLRGGARKDQVLATLYYFKRYRGQPHMTAAEIKTALRQAKVPKAKDLNINAVINQSAPNVHSTGAKQNGSFLFELTGTGEQYIAGTLGVVEPAPLVKGSATQLEGVVSGVADEVVRGYLDEAMSCLDVNALRAAVVFVWTGAVRTLQEAAFAQGQARANAAILKHDPKARAVKKLDDFAYVKDKILLLACGELGILDKGERGTLEDALNLRNRCGHPTKYKPGVAKAHSFIEDVVGIVWP